MQRDCSAAFQRGGERAAPSVTHAPPLCPPSPCARQVIYIAPLKALVRERMTDWGHGLCARLGKSMVELTGAHGRLGGLAPNSRGRILRGLCMCKFHVVCESPATGSTRVTHAHPQLPPCVTRHPPQAITPPTCAPSWPLTSSSPPPRSGTASRATGRRAGALGHDREQTLTLVPARGGQASGAAHGRAPSTGRTRSAPAATYQHRRRSRTHPLAPTCAPNPSPPPKLRAQGGAGRHRRDSSAGGRQVGPLRGGGGHPFQGGHPRIAAAPSPLSTLCRLLSLDAGPAARKPVPRPACATMHRYTDALPPAPCPPPCAPPRGPILEVIVSRMRYVAAEFGRNVRFLGLSTALANAQVGPRALLARRSTFWPWHARQSQGCLASHYRPTTKTSRGSPPHPQPTLPRTWRTGWASGPRASSTSSQACGPCRSRRTYRWAGLGGWVGRRRA